MLSFFAECITHIASKLRTFIRFWGRYLQLTCKWGTLFGAFGIYFHYDFFGCSAINFYHKQGVIPLNGTNVSCREIWKEFLGQLFYAPRRYYPTPYAVFNWSQMMISCNLSRIYDVILGFRLILYRPSASKDIDAVDRIIGNEAALQFEYQRSHFVSASTGSRIELKYLTPRELCKHRVHRHDVKLEVSKEKRRITTYASTIWRAIHFLRLRLRSADEAWRTIWQRTLRGSGSEVPRMEGLYVRRNPRSRVSTRMRQFRSSKGRVGIEAVRSSPGQLLSKGDSRRRPLEATSENSPQGGSNKGMRKRLSDRARWASEKSRSLSGGKIYQVMKVKQRVRRCRDRGRKLRLSRSAIVLRTVCGKLEASSSRKAKLLTQNTGVVLLVLPSELQAEQAYVRFIVEDLVQRYGFAVIVYDFKLSRRVRVTITNKSSLNAVDQANALGSVDPMSKMSLFEQSRVMMRNTMAIGGLMPSAPDKWALGALATKQLHPQPSLSYQHEGSRVEADVKEPKRQNSTTKRFFNNLLWKSKKSDTSLPKGTYSVKDVSSTEEGLTDPLRSESMDFFPIQPGRLSPKKKRGDFKSRRRGRLCRGGDIVDQVEQLRALLTTLCLDMKPTASLHVMTLSFGSVAAIASVSEFGAELLSMMQKKDARRTRDSNCSDESSYQIAVRNLMHLKAPEAKTDRVLGKHTVDQINKIRAHLKSLVCVSPPTCLPRTLLSLEMEEHQLIAKALTVSSDRSIRCRKVYGRFSTRPMRERWRSLASHFPQGRLVSADYASTFYPKHDKFKDRLACVQSLAQWNFWRLAQNLPVPCLVLAAKDDPLVPWTSLPIVRAINVNPFVLFALTERGAHGLFFTGLAPRPWSSAIAGDFMDAVGRTPCKIPTAAIQQWMGAKL